jgi:L-threonylcarbamoyladenylate synthase
MQDLERALQHLDDGDVVGLPTETVYGLAARIDRPAALEKIFRTKERPFFDPLIVHVASIEQAKTCVSQWPERAQALAEKFWPGPLTLVLPKSESVSPLITSGLSTVGLRCPDHPLALELIRRAGVPLAAPSANRFGRTSPTRAEHVREELGDQVFVLDGGPSRVGIESTIVSVEGDILKLLRPGMISIPEIEGVLKALSLPARWQEPSGKTEAPGQMKHHYMPSVPLILVSSGLSGSAIRKSVEERWAEVLEIVEGVRLVRPHAFQNLVELHLSEEPALAARELYQKLREASASKADLIYLVWPSSKRSGDWSAVWDRLRKAASLQID